MRFIKQLNVFLIMVLLFGASQLAAQNTSADAQAITGTWAWTHKGKSKKSTECEVRLVEKNGKVNCTFRAGNKVYKSDDGTFKDGTFHLAIEVKEGKKYVFTGKPEKNRIKGTYCVPSTGDKELDWVAKKTVSLSEFVGTWKLFFETPDGVRLEPTFDLKEVDGKPEVTFADGPEIEVANTKFRRGVLIIAADVMYEGEEVEVEYELSFKKNVIDGILYFAFKSNDNEGELEVEGERVK